MSSAWVAIALDKDGRLRGWLASSVNRGGYVECKFVIVYTAKTIHKECEMRELSMNQLELVSGGEMAPMSTKTMVIITAATAVNPILGLGILTGWLVNNP